MYTKFFMKWLCYALIVLKNKMASNVHNLIAKEGVRNMKENTLLEKNILLQNIVQ